MPNTLTKTKSTMTRTQIYIPKDLLIQAKITAQSKGFNLSQYLRDLLTESQKEVEIKPNMALKKIKSFSIPGLKKGEKVTYSTDHNDIYDY